MATKEQKTSTDVTTTAVAQLELIQKAIFGEAELPIADPAAMSRNIMERILAADSFEQAFTQQNLTPWRSMIGRVVKVTDVHFNRSTIENATGPSIYAVVDVVDLETGEANTVTCGGQNVLAQLVVMVKNGWQDKPVRLIENKTSEGYGALWLEAA